MAAHPKQEYSRRLEVCRASLTAQERQEERIANARLLVFIAGIAIAVLAWRIEWVSWWWLVLPLAVFIALVIRHERVLRAKQRAAAGVKFYEAGIARMEDRWTGQGLSGDEFTPPQHPYAVDLDIFGRGSLFELICTATTRTGQHMIAQWLYQPADVETIRARQQAVQELRDRIDLREELSFFGREMQSKVHPRTLEHWALRPSLLHAQWPRQIAVALAVAGIASIFVWWAFDFFFPFLVVVVVDVFLLAYLRHALAEVEHALEEPSRELPVLAKVLDRLEREPVKSPLLAELQAALKEGEVPASRRIRHLARLVYRHEAQRNQLFAPIVILLLWPVHTAYALEAWRRDWGRAIPRWLDAAGEMEALCALAAYAYEHSDDPFPELVENELLFEAEEAGHPLIPAAVCVRNSLRLDAAQQALIVSGSNMSGKSTLLRTVGINAVLAQAGAPVRAKRLRLCPLSIGATMRVHDSIQEGTSRFYAEIRRLKLLKELVHGGRPLLFLLDEILHGTNSHDRRIGAAEIVKGFVEGGALGLVTTHDLAITQITEGMQGKAGNIHFLDHFEGGEIKFDY
ncbi:MAG: DNA mismatch repair protein MutS, partial [Candidatus Hydrogenedentes bacterium]|nr:DNA mismatch repair protein MutS [Candidatus Hydrogenedentota bacterium]